MSSRSNAFGACLGLVVDALQRGVHELAEQLLVLRREAEHATDHVHRDVLGVLDGGVDDGLAGDDLAHLVEQLRGTAARISSSHGSICFGANGGSSRRRATLWNGGSLVIGGAPPIGAGSARSPGRVVLITTAPAGEVVGVVRDVVHRVVGERHPHAAVPIGVGDRATRLAELLPHLGRLGVVLGAAVVEVGGEVGDRAVVGRVVRRALPELVAFGAVAGREVRGRAASLSGRRGRGWRVWRVSVMSSVFSP